MLHNIFFFNLSDVTAGIGEKSEGKSQPII